MQFWIKTMLFFIKICVFFIFAKNTPKISCNVYIYFLSFFFWLIFKKSPIFYFNYPFPPLLFLMYTVDCFSPSFKYICVAKVTLSFFNYCNLFKETLPQTKTASGKTATLKHIVSERHFHKRQETLDCYHCTLHMYFMFAEYIVSCFHCFTFVIPFSELLNIACIISFGLF